MPSKEIKIGVCLPKDLSISGKILKDLRLLGKLCHICAKNQDSIIEDKVKQDCYMKIQELNEKLDLEIKELTEATWSNERSKELKAW